MVQDEIFNFQSSENFTSFVSEKESITTEEFMPLSIESFNLGQVAGLGMIVGGTGLIGSLLVLGILSILRSR